MVDDNYNFENSGGHHNRIQRTKEIKLLVLGLMITLFVLFTIVDVYPGFINHKTEAATATAPTRSASGNTTHQPGPNSTATNTSASNTTPASKIKIKEKTNTTGNGTTNATKNKSNDIVAKNTNTNSSTSQPNSNVSKLTTTQGNITANANAPGSPFPPKEANSTSYFPPTNKVAIVVGAALLRDKAYQPNPVNIKAGGVVTWNNEDTVVHTVTSGTGLQDPHLGNQFDSGLLGSHFSHIFFKAGVFPYFCQIHPTMVGKVIVK